MSDSGLKNVVSSHLQLLIAGQGRSPAQAVSMLIEQLGVDPGLVNEVLEDRSRVAKELIEATAVRVWTEPVDHHQSWYQGPRSDDMFWPALTTLLSKNPRMAGAVAELDRTSTDIVGLLGAPWSERIRTRGLVVGYVQSGKTANFTAVMAKAADAGYRLFIVLSGIHNSLRRQTQDRLQRELVDPSPHRWVTLTNRDADFGYPVTGFATLQTPALRSLAVVKKNATRLVKLKRWLNEAFRIGALVDCPILIIDDESDQATLNTAKNAELDRTRINELIGDLLALPRVAFVGYTATPFANVLADPRTEFYPRSFIYALPRPPGYFGARELFGLGDVDDAPDPHDMVREIPTDESASHYEAGKGRADAEVTPSLDRALRWFLLATAAREIRAGRSEHSSMLIHTTSRAAPHDEYRYVVAGHLTSLRDGIRTGRLLGELREQWDDETAREPAARHGYDPVDFDAVAARLPAVVQAARVVVDNYTSTDRLLYGEEPATVIAVGGNTLSRGLTLEGLVCSYFVRTSNTYDALLQMGRWFGYRPGYGDLPRVWTTAELRDDFRFLASVEDDVRAEIERYRVELAKPTDFPVKIRLHHRLQITSRLKMQFAVQTVWSFSGQRPQTILFDTDDSSLAANWRHGADLVRDARGGGAERLREPGRVVLTGLPVELVLRFLGQYRFHRDSDLKSDAVTGYIAKQVAQGHLLKWNLVIADRSENTLGSADLGDDAPVNLIQRSRVRHADPATANINALMSKEDRILDLMPAAEGRKLDNDLDRQRRRTDSGRAAVVLYPIAGSTPHVRPRGDRLDLGLSRNVLGVALSFPAAPNETDEANWVQVDPTHLVTADGTTPDDEGLTEYTDTEADADTVTAGGGGS
jgi:hypothetical protein